ncbi:glycerol-3-phosphate dehydrogenase [Helicobacter mustelae]|uniref:glycerol-3-phosphate dehydrogenase/oxidase n=1 Tax=Helicobacter mustelae TaxID=217 RepID=UPI000DF8C95D|nr:glycerol-3-phosphate dehydrogenase/oxidase [Helicobacter mustelae]STP12384.1 glycerol-3-phosphate dehydrogenase [Helicobacter mustelae]
MDRMQEYNKLKETSLWDVVIIGGGATGLGIALDSALRGYKTLLCEALDFAQGTSSRSTKLLHGGVRYLAQGEIGLVYEALHERDRVIRNAPHLCKKQAFVIPNTSFFDACFYTFGLKIYDFIAGAFGIGKTSYLSANKARSRLRGIKEHKISSGVCYYDGQFDDARLALNLAQSAAREGACVLNYARVESLLKNQDGEIEGVGIRLQDTQEILEVHSRCVINASGVFGDGINAMDHARGNSIMPSQGIHLVFDKSFLPGNDALMIPKTPDGRVLFAIPWYDKVVVGTTDTLVNDICYEPSALDEEIAFILNTFGEYATKTPGRDDVLSVFAGLRPLVKQDQSASTKDISRKHKISLSPSKLITINGGKWTTYRRMAQDCLDFIIKHQLLPKSPCKTQDYKIYGYKEDGDPADRLHMYGDKAEEIYRLEEQDPRLKKPIHKDYSYTFAQIFWALEHEMAQHLDDVLARRIRLLFLDARAARACAKDVAHFMAEHLAWSQSRLESEIESFMKLSERYYLK